MKSHALKGHAILVVDDEPDNLKVLRNALKYYGAEVVTADNGSNALDTLSTFVPTLIITDLSMPGLDGYNLFDVINGRPERPPIIALTANAMKGDKEHALAHGFDGYIPKPIQVRVLAADILAIISKFEAAKSPSAVIVQNPETSTAADMPESDTIVGGIPHGDSNP